MNIRKIAAAAIRPVLEYTHDPHPMSNSHEIAGPWGRVFIASTSAELEIGTTIGGTGYPYGIRLVDERRCSSCEYMGERTLVKVGDLRVFIRTLGAARSVSAQMKAARASRLAGEVAQA